MARGILSFSQTRSALYAFLIVCLTLMLAACGDSPPSGTSTSGTTSGAGSSGSSVDMTGFKFVPNEITVPVGTTVTWTNKESAKHAVTEDNGAFDSGTLEKGAVFTHTFDTPGTISYYCKFHGSPGKGMFGRIIVTGAGTNPTEASPTAANTAVAVVVATDTPAPPAATATEVVEAATATATAVPPPAVAGSVHFSDNLGLTDQLVLNIDAMPSRPAGKAFYGWLINSANGNNVSLGRLSTAAGENSLTLKYEDPANGNLLAGYDSFLVTNEDLESVPAAPSTDIALSGQLPPKALVHLRHLLVSFDAAPNKIGLEVGLRQQVDLVRQHAQFMRDAQDSGNFAAVKLHAEHLVNIIEGANGAHYGDLNKDGKITNPGDGYGLLANGNQLGYLQGSKDHAELAATADDATDDIKLHAGHVGITVDNVSGWVTEIRDKALQVGDAPDLTSTDQLVKEILALSGQALNGVDLKGDGQVLPVPGSGGALTSYQHAQLMANIPLLAGGQIATTAGTEEPATAVPAEPTATIAPVEPTATTAAATGPTLEIPTKDFVFGDPVTVKVGTTVTWTNLDDAPHTVTADDGSFDSGVFEKDETYSHTFTTAGVINYYCAVHGGPNGQGMASKITVEP